MSKPWIHAAAVTPNDDNDLPRPAEAVYVGSVGGGAGLVGITPGGETVTFAGLLAGNIYEIPFIRIKATGTTASSLIALSGKEAI